MQGLCMSVFVFVDKGFVFSMAVSQLIVSCLSFRYLVRSRVQYTEVSEFSCPLPWSLMSVFLYDQALMEFLWRAFCVCVFVLFWIFSCFNIRFNVIDCVYFEYAHLCLIIFISNIHFLAFTPLKHNVLRIPYNQCKFLQCTFAWCSSWLKMFQDLFVSLLACRCVGMCVRVCVCVRV